jgi:hypothetical protein
MFTYMERNEMDLLMAAVETTRACPKGQSKIMIVDDDPDLRHGFKKATVPSLRSSQRTFRRATFSILDYLPLDFFSPPLDSQRAELTQAA